MPEVFNPFLNIMSDWKLNLMAADFPFFLLDQKMSSNLDKKLEATLHMNSLITNHMHI